MCVCVFLTVCVCLSVSLLFLSLFLFFVSSVVHVNAPHSLHTVGVCWHSFFSND